MVTPAASAVPCLPGGGGWPPIPASPAGSLHAEREAEGILVLLGLLRLSSDPLPGSGPYPPGGYWLTRIVFLRFLGSIYFIAFFSLSHQIEPLIGQNGILPARAYLDRVAAATGEGVAAWKAVPSLFWADASDETLVAAARAGTGLSLLLLAGFDNAVLLALLWVLYSSLVNVGQLFYGYGWEMLLLETGFLAIFLCPVRRGVLLPEGRAPSPAVMFLIRWVLFRVMFGAGLIKIRGDECWRDLTCLVYHYETQPLPNPLSWYLHQMPPFIHKLGVLWNHFIELIVPFFLFGPRRVRIAGGLLLIAFQATLILSGNLSWLNWLTISLCIPCLDDRALQFLFTRRFLRRVEAAQSTGGRGLAARIAVALLALLVLYLSINPVLNLISPQQRMNASFDPFHLVNTYGAFGHIGKQRFEIILEGTAEESITPSTVWLPYEFKCKPGDVTRRPCVVAPYHYRLDWQIWFAAMSEYRRQPWLMHFTYKLLQGDRGVLGLLAGNPFPDRPPKFIRAELYLYQFTTFEERSRAWWKRTRVGEYFSPVSLDNPWFLKFLQAYGWGR
ncbi:MAG: lipase maturation factor family protein [Planctomycetes bacterium]|nr:lipase maturation factor family protein [Planctomycetota bacterium]